MNDFLQEEFYGEGYECGQKHDHEFEGSVMIADYCNGGRDLYHNHRFTGVTGEAIEVPGGHIHEYRVRTDYYLNHYHFIRGKTGNAIYVGGGKHVHYDENRTTRSDEHIHALQFATEIENPLVRRCKKKCCDMD